MSNSQLEELTQDAIDTAGQSLGGMTTSEMVIYAREYTLACGYQCFIRILNSIVIIQF